MAADWLGSVITASAGFAGTLVGAGISYLAQRNAHNSQRREDAAALASALGAEIAAYLELMKIRDHVANAKALAAGLRDGRIEQIRGFLDEEAKPLDEFPFFKSAIGRLGSLGPDLSASVATYYTLISAVQVTVIAAQRGRYDSVGAARKAEIVEHEAALWQKALSLGEQLLPKLRVKAGALA